MKQTYTQKQRQVNETRKTMYQATHTPKVSYKKLTICISNFINTWDIADQDQGESQKKPVHDWNINLAHEFPRGMDNFKTRKATECSGLFNTRESRRCHSPTCNKGSYISYEEDRPESSTYSRFKRTTQMSLAVELIFNLV